MTPKNRDELIVSIASAMAINEGRKLSWSESYFYKGALLLLSQIEDFGLAIVPVEPTQNMEDAHFDAHAKAVAVFADVPDIWRAMLAASPFAKEEG